MRIRKFILLPLLLLLMNIGFSQVVFCPPGAEWSNQFAQYWGPPQPIYWTEKITYQRDTVIGSDTMKILKTTRMFTECQNKNPGLTLIWQRGDTIYFKNNVTANQWQVLYNFAAQPGESWTTGLFLKDNVPKTYTITVNSTGTTQVNGFTLKNMNVKYAAYGTNNYIDSNRCQIIERIGCNRFLFHYKNETVGFCDVDNFVWPLCYKDSVFGLKQFTNYACDNATGIGEAQQIHADRLIYPNPGRDDIYVENFNGQYLDIRVCDTGGKELIHQRLQNNKNTISVATLTSGVYFVRLCGSMGLNTFNKLIILR